jgi:hypothetical protein
MARKAKSVAWCAAELLLVAYTLSILAGCVYKLLL